MIVRAVERFVNDKNVKQIFAYFIHKSVNDRGVAHVDGVFNRSGSNQYEQKKTKKKRSNGRV